MHLRLALSAALTLACGCATTPPPDAAGPPPDAARPPPPATPASAAPFDANRCGPEIAHLEALDSVPMILLGELHGLVAAPAFAVDLACRLAATGKPALLALEIPRQEQGRIDSFMASKGAPADRAALLEGAFWHREFQDGRSSQARVAMLETARVIRAQGVPLRVACIDDTDATPGPKRDEAMATGLLAAKKPDETAVLLAGNLHVRTRPGAPWDPKMVWSGVYLREKEPKLLALDNRYAAGEAWACFGNKPSDCGVKPVKARGEARSFGIERFAATNEEGLDGVFDLGAAAASLPAVGER